jgi:hypothetical protein
MTVKPLPTRSLPISLFLKRFIAEKVCTAFSRTNYKIVPLTNLNKYLHNGIIVNIYKSGTRGGAVG